MSMASYKLSPEQKERKLEWQRQSRAKDRERYRAYDRAHYERVKNDPEFKAKNRAKVKSWQKANHEKMLQQARDWTAKNPQARWAINKKWVDANLPTRRLMVRRYRAKKKGSTVGVIVLTEIHNWYTGICGICGKLIEGKYEFDHIIPISKGGPHITKNLQKAHPKCNRVKSDTLI